MPVVQSVVQGEVIIPAWEFNSILFMNMAVIIMLVVIVIILLRLRKKNENKMPDKVARQPQH